MPVNGGSKISPELDRIEQALPAQGDTELQSMQNSSFSLTSGPSKSQAAGSLQPKSQRPIYSISKMTQMARVSSRS